MLVLNLFYFFYSIFVVYLIFSYYFVCDFDWVYLCLEKLLDINCFQRILALGLALLLIVVLGRRLDVLSHVLHISQIYCWKHLNTLRQQIIKFHVIALILIFTVLHRNQFLLFLLFGLRLIPRIGHHRKFKPCTRLNSKISNLLLQFRNKRIFLSDNINWFINGQSVRWHLLLHILKITVNSIDIQLFILQQLFQMLLLQSAFNELRLKLQNDLVQGAGVCVVVWQIVRACVLVLEV